MRTYKLVVYFISFIVIYHDLPAWCTAGYCAESYQCPSTCYRRESYTKACGFLNLDRCKRYRQKSYACTTTCSRQVCCQGFTGANCASPVCYGSTSCQNEGKCVAPDDCQCITGFQKPKCDDINECNSSIGGCKHSCVNTLGSFRCQCLTGYLLASDTTSCIEINECNKNRGGCQQTCSNTPGSFKCGCNPEYSLNSDQKTCRDVDECSIGTHNCSQNCHNTQGSFTCSCNAGYSLALDKLACEDNDECATNTAGCGHYCQNTVGSYICTCSTGYALGYDVKTCNEIDECSSSNGNCGQLCVNNPGSYSCECNTGYNMQFDTQSCTDIDECSSGLSNCEHVCINIPGSFNCICKEGYQLNKDGRTCTDIDDCASVRCKNGGSCIDGIASYSCHCTSPYTGPLCESDIDECSFLNGGCEDLCTNSIGSYYCRCSGNATLNNDGRSCSGGQDTGDVFRRHEIARKLLPRGCSEIILTKCTDGNEITVYLSSTSNWYMLKSNRQIVYTYGVVFAEVNSLAIPVSIPGVEVTMSEGDFQIKLGTGVYPDNAGDYVGKLRSEGCWQINFTSKDIFDFVESASFLKSYFYSLLESLPDWVKLQPTNDTILDVQGLKTELTYGRDIGRIDWCRGAPVLPEHLYSLFIFDTSFYVSVYANPLVIPKPLNQTKFCLIVDLCHNYGGTVFLMIPKESQHQFSEIDIFKQLYVKNNMQILPRGIGLSVVRGVNVNVHKQTTSLTLWNGDHTFSYPVLERANIWISGYFTSITSYLEVKGSADIFVSVPKPDRILTAMFLDEWIGLFSLRGDESPIIKFQLFGNNYTLSFPYLVDINTDVYMSVGGQQHRTMCGDNSNPQGLFLSSVIRINPFQDIPILKDWDIVNPNTIQAFLITDPASKITDDFKVDIKDYIRLIRDRAKHFKQFLNLTAVTIEEVLNSTDGILTELRRAVDKLEQLSDKNISSVDSFVEIADIITDMWKLNREIQSSTDRLRAKVEFLVDVAEDNYTSLIEFEKDDMESKIKVAVHKLIYQVSLAKDYLGFGLKYKTSVRISGFKFVGLNIEFVYSTSGIGHCTKFSKVYQLLEGQRSARLLATYSEGVKFGYFLSADAGMGIGGALGIDNKTVILQVNAYINMLGITITGDMFISEKGLYFFIEGNLWNIFLVQVDVSAEPGDDWYQLLFKLEGRFVAKTRRRRRQVQTADTSSFQASYLDALKKVITVISDETEKRILLIQNDLEAAKKELTNAQNWLSEKKNKLQSANAAFDDASVAFEKAKDKLVKAKIPFQIALEKLRSAQINVDRLCRIRECRKICVPGIRCKTCRRRVWSCTISYRCCSFSGCMISFKDPICIAKNFICKGIRYIAYSALEVAKIFVKAPMVAFDVAKAGVSVAHFVLDKSRVVVDLAEGVFDLAKLGIEGAIGVLNIANRSLEAVKIAVGEAAKVLELVIEYGVKNVIDVRNCGFSLELSTTDLSVFDVSCEVNAFKLGWQKIVIPINFKNAFQTIWQAAKATIKSIMKQFHGLLSKRSIGDIIFKSTLQLHKFIRHIRNSGPDSLNMTNTGDNFKTTLFVVSEMNGFNTETINDYDNRVLLFHQKCSRIRNILNFFNNTFEVLHEIVNQSVANLDLIDGLNGQLLDLNTSHIAENMTLDDADISSENALNDYNISKEELEQALLDAKKSLINDPMLIEISKSADFTKGILDSELRSVESFNIISQWTSAMENVSKDFFDETECVSFSDCIFYSISILYDLYTFETLPEIDLTRGTISSLEDNILELFQNTSDNARSVYNTSAQLFTNSQTLTSMNLFCSEAPSFIRTLKNVTVTLGQTATLKCLVTADPSPIFWWYKNTIILEMETSDTLIIANVSNYDEGVYRCMAGNVVANITSKDVHVIVTELDDKGEEETERRFDLKLFFGILFSGLTVVMLTILIAALIVHQRRKTGRTTSKKNNGSEGEQSEEASTCAQPALMTQYSNKLYEDYATLPDGTED